MKQNNYLLNFLKVTFFALLLIATSPVRAEIKVVTTIKPLHSLIANVMDGVGEPSLIIEGSTSPHSFTLKPSHAKLLEEADIIFWVGEGIETFMERPLESIVKNAEVVEFMEIESINKLKFREESIFEDHDDHDDHSSAKHDDHDDHDKGHGEEAFEWAGVFELSPGTYTWSFAKVDGDYADPAMKMVILKSGDIEASEDLAEELLESKNSEVKRNNDKLVAQEKAYVLTFNERKDSTTFNVEIKKAGKYAFFTEHMPFEFEADEHFFKDVSGDDIEPIAQVPDEGGDHHHHDHGGLDPHVWHDPHNIIKMGNVISKNLNKKISFFDRETKKVLKERTQAVNSILEDLDQWTQRQVSTIPSNQRTIVSKHKAMEYYGDAFGLKTISLLDFLGHSASLRPQTISKVLTELREENVQVIFPEQKPPSKLLKNLSRQTSTPIAKQQIFVDGLMPTGNTISVAVHNTCTIVNSLGGSCNKKAGNQLENRWDSLTKR